MRVVRVLFMTGVAAVALSACQSGQANRSTPGGVASNSPTTSVALLSGPEIASRAARAIDTNSSVRVRGTVPGSPHVVFDVVKQNLTDGMCTLTVDGQAVHIIRVDGHDYAKADATFWKTLGPPGLRTTTAAARAHGKYVRGTLFDGDFGALTRYLDLPQYAWETLRDNPNVVKGDRAVINGVPTIAIQTPGLGTVHVATEGEPYVIRITSAKDDSVTIDFSEYLEPVEITAPPADQIVDKATLKPNEA